MASIKDIKTQIENANALGRANLTEKGVEIAENATTYEIMQSIAGISSEVVESKGVKLNIAYGETAPEDTSKLWIKANEPNNIKLCGDNVGVESVTKVMSSFPIAYTSMCCASVGTNIYFFGGITSNNAVNTIYMLDTTTQIITKLGTTLPSTRAGMCCASVGTVIYLFGGIVGSTKQNTIYAFDTETKTIRTLSAVLPTKTDYMRCASVGNKIYLFGGYDVVVTNKIYVFDTENETIRTSGTVLPNAAAMMGCAAIGTKIYLFGGGLSSGADDKIKLFDTETESIATLSEVLPEPLSYIGCAGVGTNIYLFGGNTIYVFDTETKTIRTSSTTLPERYSEMCCAGVGTNIYLLSGNKTDMFCFSVTYELAQGSIEIQISLLNNKFNLVNTENAQVEIGVKKVYFGNENNEAEVVDAYLHNGTDWQQI